MNIIFITNVDKYRRNCFPTGLQIPPRIGESVSVLETFKSHYFNQKLPTRMEVVDVIWEEDCVVCELWYKKIDVEKAKILGIQLY